MLLGEHVYGRLSTDVVLGTLVTGSTGIRIYPMHLYQACGFPAIAFTIISDLPAHAMGEDSPIHEARVQVSSFSSTAITVRAVATAVFNSLSRWRNTVGICDSLFDNEVEIYENETGIYHIAQDFIIYHNTDL